MRLQFLFMLQQLGKAGSRPTYNHIQSLDNKFIIGLSPPSLRGKGQYQEQLKTCRGKSLYKNRHLDPENFRPVRASYPLVAVYFFSLLPLVQGVNYQPGTLENSGDTIVTWVCVKYLHLVLHIFGTLFPSRWLCVLWVTEPPCCIVIYQCLENPRTTLGMSFWCHASLFGGMLAQLTSIL